MIPRPPSSTRTDTLFPYTTLFRSILRAGLTNTPALELAAVASEQPNHGDIMDLSKIAQALGLGEDATEEKILSAIADLAAATSPAPQMGQLANAAGLAEGASVAGLAQRT